MKYPWLLFDVDNTLFDFTHSSRLAFIQTLEKTGIPFHDELYTIYQRENHKVWHEFEEGKIDAIQLRPKRFRLFLEATGLSGDPVSLNHNYLQELIEHASLLDGALHLLESLHQKYKMVIITNGLQEVQRPRINKVDIGHFFDEIIVSDEIGVAKPNASFFDYTFEKIGMPPKEEVLVIGDSLNSDIKGGHNYGLATCWYNPRRLDHQTEIKPKYEIQNLAELHNII